MISRLLDRTASLPRIGAARRLLIGVALASAVAGPLGAQTDYYNTDEGRPVRIEDAFPVERYAFELQLAPLTVQRSSGGSYEWGVEPELAYGGLPRTHFAVALPVSFATGGGVEERAAGGVELGLFHNLNAETERFPALAVEAEVLLPFDENGGEGAYPSLKGIATRTFSFARFHVNGAYTFGRDMEGEGEGADRSRWLAGLGVDHALPLQSTLLMADVFVEEPLLRDARLHWTTEAGARVQLSPFFSVDGGIGRRWSGPSEGWFVTLGLARAFSVRSLFSVPGRGLD